MRPITLVASTNGTFTITVDPKNCGSCGSSLDGPTEPEALPSPLPERKEADPAKRKRAKAARKARRRSR